ncbi:MAG: hypothetical protein MEP57_03405 [Microvirga sp.]|nr:hypothetical protein [Microvirga sp.]
MKIEIQNPQQPVGSRQAADFTSVIAQARSTTPSECRHLLRKLQGETSTLSELVAAHQRSQLNGDRRGGLDIWARAQDLLESMGETIGALGRCLEDENLTSAEKELLGRVVDRIKDLAGAGDLDLPDQIFESAKRGDTDALARFARGAGKAVEAILTVLIGVAGLLSGQYRQRGAF